MDNLKKLNEFELAQYFQDNLIIRATGGDFNNELFVFVRNELLKNKALEPYLPKWLNTTRTIEQFWPLIKAKFQHYSERKEYLWNEFAPLLNYLENKIVSPINTAISFDEAHIHNEWQKALERKESDPEGAITSARTLLESVLKYILDEQAILYKEGIDLPELYKEVSKSLNLAPEQHQEQIFKQILSGTHSVVNGLGALRNKLGDAHGKSKSNVKPKERHSELAVNLAGSVSIFLIKTFKDIKK
jgi:hypothetical protein